MRFAIASSPLNRNRLLSVDMEADISQLEAPTFTTISRGPPEPMLRLKWDIKVNLIGEKVLNPMIHCCDQCEKPILIYGRMIPCKHVFCLHCARSEPIKICPRCKDKVLRVEQSGLGTVFMCTHGGSRYGNTGCRRTYLSQRDLQAHINHRHITQSSEGKIGDPKANANQRKCSISNEVSQSRQGPVSRSGQIANVSLSASSGRGNLISDQIHIASSISSNAGLHHHQSSHTMAKDLSSYYSPSEAQYGGSSSSAGHNMPVSTSSAPFYSSYAQYNPIQTPAQSVHYSNAAIQAPTSQHQSNQQSQQSWSQQSYYR